MTQQETSGSQTENSQPIQADSTDQEKHTPSELEKPEKTVLVIGDLFIDENWLMAKTDNYHSTDVGDTHYNSLIKGPDSFVLSVCGIANVLKVLCGSGGGVPEKEKTEESFKDKFKVVGIGAWNPMDTDRVKRILCPNNKEELLRLHIR